MDYERGALAPARDMLVIKGRRIGVGRPKTVVSLMGDDAAKVYAQANEAMAQRADCLEWRVDFLAKHVGEADVARIARELGRITPTTPLIATIRTEGQGGQRAYGEETYLELCHTLIESGGPDMVDIELDKPADVVRPLVDAAHAHGLHALVSHHDFVATPATDRMVKLLCHMASLGADLPKLAVMARSRADCFRLMEASARTSERLRMPVVAISMGAHGTLSRLAGESCGSALTFCAVGDPSAPGQVELGQARHAIDQLHAALALQAPMHATCGKRRRCFADALPGVPTCATVWPSVSGRGEIPHWR